MCLIFFAYQAHPQYDLILASNRDEFLNRPTKEAFWWPTSIPVLAGQDLQAGGTWLGINSQNKLAALTNYRDSQKKKEKSLSRGRIINDFLLSQETASSFLDKLILQVEKYNHFNLLLKDADNFFYFSSLKKEKVFLKKGIYGLSNAFLDTPWPKVEKGKKLFREKIKISDPEMLFAELFNLLHNQQKPPEEDLPQTGVGLEWEQILAPIFIDHPVYGTKSSAVILVDKKKQVFFREKTFNLSSSEDLVSFSFPWCQV